MKSITGVSVLAIMLASTAANAQDVVVMRRVISPPNAVATPPVVVAPTQIAGWKVEYGQWSSECSQAAVRTNQVTCERSGGRVADDQCNEGIKPAAQDTQERISACTSTPAYAEYGTCTSNTPGSTKGTQSAPIVSCTRSDGKALATSSCSPQADVRACTPPNTSDQYFRQPSSLTDPYIMTNQTTSYKTVNNSAAGMINLTVNAVQCWDDVEKKVTTSSFCGALTHGANLYDYATIPATYVTGLHEVYINKADVTAAMPNADLLMGMKIDDACMGATTYVGKSGVHLPWKLYCGTPDSAENYQRMQALDAILDVRDMNPATPSVNFSVYETKCVIKATGATASNNKCSYLTTGVNVGDVMTLNASYVPNLREVYFSPSDVVAAANSGRIIVRSNLGRESNAVDPDLFCNGYILPETNYKVRCGAADSADNYQRVQALAVALDVRGIKPASTVVTTTVASTKCIIKETGATADARKCDYLPTGVNVGDSIMLNAIYVPDLREVYFDTAEVVAAANGSNIQVRSNLGRDTANVSSTSFCNGYVFPDINYKARCGTPDSADNYQRVQGSISLDVRKVTPASTEVATTVASTKCVIKATGATVADTRKCDYLPAGVNVGDSIMLNAIYVPDLREVYFDTAEVVAAANGSNIQVRSNLGRDTANISSTSFCNGYVFPDVNYKTRCGTPDSADNYRRVQGAGASLDSRNIIAGSSVLKLTMRTTKCINSTTGATVTDTRKCEYLPSGANVGDAINLNVSYSSSLREMYVSRAEIDSALNGGTLGYFYNLGRQSTYVSATTFCGGFTLSDTAYKSQCLNP